LLGVGDVAGGTAGVSGALKIPTAFAPV